MESFANAIVGFASEIVGFVLVRLFCVCEGIWFCTCNGWLCALKFCFSPVRVGFARAVVSSSTRARVIFVQV